MAKELTIKARLSIAFGVILAVFSSLSIFNYFESSAASRQMRASKAESDVSRLFADSALSVTRALLTLEGMLRTGDTQEQARIKELLSHAVSSLTTLAGEAEAEATRA